MATHHQRFALHDVTLAGVALPGATLDCWEQGGARWSARLVTKRGQVVDAGELVGRISDGRVVSGQATIGDRMPAGNGILVTFHGSGPLRGF